MSILNPLKGKTTLTYDTHGNLIEKTDANNNTTTYSYTREQQLKSQTNALNQSSYLEYDELGRVKRYINPNHQRTQYFYDRLDRITSTKDAMGNVLNYKYNKKAQLEAIIDPLENPTQYAYDKYGRVEKERLPTQKTITRVYNKDHTLKTLIRMDSSEVNFSYNAFRQPIEIEAQEGHTKLNPPTQTLLFGYNEVGRLNWAKSSSAKVELFYNKLGELNQEIQFEKISVKSHTNAKTSTKTLNYLNLTTTIHNDFTKQQKSISKDTHTQPITIEYDKNGIETKILYPNGLEESYGFDKNYNLKTIQTGKTTLHYEYNANGEITAKNAMHYRYDSIGRLIQAGTQEFSYDKAGNNLANQSIYDKESNRLLENRTHRFIYDVRGNLIQKRAKNRELYS